MSNSYSCSSRKIAESCIPNSGTRGGIAGGGVAASRIRPAAGRCRCQGRHRQSHSKAAAAAAAVAAAAQPNSSGPSIAYERQSSSSFIRGSTGSGCRKQLPLWCWQRRCAGAGGLLRARGRIPATQRVVRVPRQRAPRARAAQQHPGGPACHICGGKWDIPCAMSERALIYWLLVMQAATQSCAP